MSFKPGFLVPYTVVEWNRVKSLFRSEHLEELDECLSLLAMWRSRMGDQVPVAISCSDLLIRVAIEEKRVEKDSSGTKMEALKMLHCITIIRFINYVNEINQPSGYAISIVNSVQKLGIPRWLVEIRHNASHSHVPPICTLRKAFHFCYNWIWDNFWVHPADEAIRSAGLAENGSGRSQDDVQATNEERINGIIIDYVRWRSSSFPYPPFDPSAPNRRVAAVQKAVLHEPYDFLRSFVSSGMLIMTPEQLEKAEIHGVSDDWHVPPLLQAFWQPIFMFISDNRLLGEFVISLMSVPATSDITSEMQALAWVRLLLGTIVDPSFDELTAMQWNRILHRMVAFSNKFDCNLIESVMKRVPNLSEKRLRQIRRILDIPTAEPAGPEDSMSIKTVEDLQNMIRDSRRMPSSSDCPFTLCDPEEWAELPIGLAPGQHYDSLSLVLDDQWLAYQDQRHAQSDNKNIEKRNLSEIAEDDEITCLN